MADIEDELGEVASIVAKLIQGAVLRIPTLPFLAATMSPVHPLAKETVANLSPDNVGPLKSAVIPARTETGLAMLLTQTCDLQERRTKGGDALVLVAPIVRLEGERHKAASSLAQPKYVPAQWIDDACFADVAQATSVDRSVVARAELVGLPSEADRRRLAYLLGRPFSRPAIPDEVVATLKPLQKIANGRHPAIRRIFDDAIDMIRILPDEEYSSEQDPSVTVIILIDSDWLPDSPPGPLHRTLSKEPERVADLLVAAFDSAGPDREGLLRRLWIEFLARIEARVQERTGLGTGVGSVSFTPATHLLPLTYTNSDELDLGHLSLDD